MHKAIRTKQLGLYQTFLQAQQIGGRQGVPVTLGGHQVRAFQRICTSRKQPSSLLFIDLQEAFYRVIRPLVVDGPSDDSLIAATAARIDLDESFLHELHAALAQPCALSDARMHLHMQRAIRALHTDFSSFRTKTIKCYPTWQQTWRLLCRYHLWVSDGESSS